MISYILFLINSRNAFRITAILLFNIWRTQGRILQQNRHSEQYFYPSDAEIERGYVIKADSSWGARIRKDNSLRIACFGGSNTDRSISYVFVLQKLLASLKVNQSSSYVYNLGLSGQGPRLKTFYFMIDPVETWPNVIILEFAVNTCGWNGALEVDKFIYFINSRYEGKNVLPPYVLLLNMYGSSSFYYDEYNRDNCGKLDKNL